MDLQELIKSITPEAYDNLKQAVETGKWANGTPLTPEQKESCLQAVIAYDAAHKTEDERVGFIHTKKHTNCSSNEKDKADDDSANDEPVPLKWN